MGLLENALRASGGLDLWRLTRRFTVHLSITGPLCAAKSSTAQLKELVVEGRTHAQELEMTGFPRADMRGLYRPARVVLEAQDVGQIMERNASPEEFKRGLQSAHWDQLQLAYYCGYLIWNYMVVPFILADPDFEAVELGEIGGTSDRRLRVVFPGRVVTHAVTQTFYFDADGFLSRQEYVSPPLGTAPIAQVFSAHQRFSGILVPTLCRLLGIGADGVPVAKPALLDIEIFDVNFA